MLLGQSCPKKLVRLPSRCIPVSVLANWKTRTSWLDILYQQVEALPLRDGDHSFPGPFLALHLETNTAGRKTRLDDILCKFPVKVIYRPARGDVLSDALLRRSLSERIWLVLQGKPLLWGQRTHSIGILKVRSFRNHPDSQEGPKQI